jgi:hypothetical protein
MSLIFLKGFKNRINKTGRQFTTQKKISFHIFVLITKHFFLVLLFWVLGNSHEFDFDALSVPGNKSSRHFN